MVSVMNTGNLVIAFSLTTVLNSNIGHSWDSHWCWMNCSFVLDKKSKLNERHPRYVTLWWIQFKFSYCSGFSYMNLMLIIFSFYSGIVSTMVSFFSSMYISKWKEFFPLIELKYPPSFDGRAVCYPSSEILQDYLSWRQVDCEYPYSWLPCLHA